jgi:hypothetical protein
MLDRRPAQPKPVSHVPVFPVPQHGCPDAPQVPHWLVVAVSRHEKPVRHGDVPPSPPPPPGQQSCPVPPQGLHMPGMPMLSSRPAQAKPAEHEPLFPVPQQGCPSPPQAPHWRPMAAIKHDRPDVHCVIPASAPPPVEQQACPVAPHAPHMPGVPVLSSRPAQPSPGVQEPLPPVPQQT